VKPDEAKHYSTVHNCVKRYSSIREIQHQIPEKSIVIVEDIINMTKEEEVVLRFFLNEHAHHKTLKMFCVGHTLYKTSLYGMLSLFNYVLFTATPSNLPLLKQTLAYFKIDKEESEEYVEIFSDRKAFGQYYYLDCQQMKMHQLNSQVRGFKEVQGPDDQMQRMKRREKFLLDRFAPFFEDHPNRVKAKSLLSIIVRAIPEHLLREIDLSVKFNWKFGVKHVSLIDYINSLVSDRGFAVEAEQQVLHRYIKSRCQLPKYLVTNRLLQ